MTRAALRIGAMPVRISVDRGVVVRVELLPLGRAAKADPAPKDPVLKRAVAQVRQYLAGKRRRFTVPYSQPGTPFQQAVWKALARVPYGRVLSYGDLAREAGHPGAARAVGGAMRRNRLPLLIPCHRVVAGDGIGGFGCGLAWKRRLLGLEGSR